MVDMLTKEKRSWLMSRVKGKNTLPEKMVFSFLRKNKVYFQKHYKRVSGTPDVALPKRKIAVFINGDFWHGRYYVRTKRKLTPFWRNKIEENIRRDRRKQNKLRREGWKVMNIWTGDLNKKPTKTLLKIKLFLERKK